jgi:hypothetical protein
MQEKGGLDATARRTMKQTMSEEIYTLMQTLSVLLPFVHHHAVDPRNLTLGSF